MLVPCLLTLAIIKKTCSMPSCLDAASKTTSSLAQHLASRPSAHALGALPSVLLWLQILLCLLYGPKILRRTRLRRRLPSSHPLRPPRCAPSAPAPPASRRGIVTRAQMTVRCAGSCTRSRGRRFLFTSTTERRPKMQHETEQQGRKHSKPYKTIN